MSSIIFYQQATALEGKFGLPKTLDEQLAHYHTPGISIAIINDFEIEWAGGFGVCEARTTCEVTPDTLFQAGSISKPVFALAVMRLAQKGRLSFDEDVNNYLTSWRVPAIAISLEELNFSRPKSFAITLL